jgi:hypothetical protein
MSSPRLKKFRKIFLYTFFTGVLLLAGAMWLVPRLLKHQMEARVKARIAEMTGGNYQVNMKDFNMNLFTNTLSASEFEMTMDTNVFKNNGNALGVNIQVQQISFTGVNYWKLLFNKTLQFNTVHISNGFARFNWNPDRRKQRNLVDKKGGIEHIIIKKIKLKNVNIDFFNEKKGATIYSGNANLHFSMLKIDQQGFPTVSALSAQFNESKFYFGTQYFSLDTTYFEYNHASLHIRLVDLNFSDEHQHMLKIFPGSKVKYSFKASELSMVFKDLSQIESLAGNETRMLSIYQVRVENPELSFYRDTLKPVDSSRVFKQTFPLFVNRMQINDGRLIVIDKVSNKTRLISDGIDLDISKLEPSPANYIIPFRASVFEIQSDSILYYHKNEMQVTKLLKISLTTDDSLLKCERLLVQTTQPEAAFFRIKQYQCDLPYVDITNFTLNGIDGDLLLERKYLYAREASATRFYLKTTRDKNYPYRPGKITPMPQDQLLGIESPFYLQKVTVTGGKIDYFEIPANGNPRGNLWIDKISILAENITNDTSLLAKNDTMHITMEGYIYSSGLLQVFAAMPLTDPQKRHYVYGKIGLFDPSNLNRITMNCAQIKIQKGTIHSGEFEFFADKNESNGELDLYFEKLKMKILTRDGDRLKGDNLKSIIASLFITHNNPEKGRDPIVGAIHWQRDPSRWITSYWWKSLFSGINNIVMSRSAQLKALERNFSQLKKQRPVFK